MTNTPTPTPTPTQQESFSDFIVKLIESLVHIDAALLFKLIGGWLLFVWAFFALWVLWDANKRYKNPLAPLFWFFFVLPFNLLGFLGYLFIRPTYTTEEELYIELDRKFLLYEANKLVTCPSCNNVVRVGQKYCNVCGTQLFKVCPNCNAEMPLHYNYCTNCGTSLVEVAAETAEREVVKIGTQVKQEKTESKKDVSQQKAKTKGLKTAAVSGATDVLTRESKSLNIFAKIKKLIINMLKGIWQIFVFIGDSVMYTLKMFGYLILYIARLIRNVLLFPINVYKAQLSRLRERMKQRKVSQSTQKNKKESEEKGQKPKNKANQKSSKQNPKGRFKKKSKSNKNRK